MTDQALTTRMARSEPPSTFVCDVKDALSLFHDALAAERLVLVDAQDVSQRDHACDLWQVLTDEFGRVSRLPAATPTEMRLALLVSRAHRLLIEDDPDSGDLVDPGLYRMIFSANASNRSRSAADRLFDDLLAAMECYADLLPESAEIRVAMAA